MKNDVEHRKHAGFVIYGMTEKEEEKASLIDIIDKLAQIGAKYGNDEYSFHMCGNLLFVGFKNKNDPNGSQIMTYGDRNVVGCGYYDKEALAQDKQKIKEAGIEVPDGEDDITCSEEAFERLLASNDLEMLYKSRYFARTMDKSDNPFYDPLTCVAVNYDFDRNCFQAVVGNYDALHIFDTKEGGILISNYAAATECDLVFKSSEDMRRGKRLLEDRAFLPYGHVFLKDGDNIRAYDFQYLVSENMSENSSICDFEPCFEVWSETDYSNAQGYKLDFEHRLFHAWDGKCEHQEECAGDAEMKVNENA